MKEILKSLLFVGLFGLVVFLLTTVFHKEQTPDQRAADLAVRIANIPAPVIDPFNRRDGTVWKVSAALHRHVGSLELVVVVGERHGIDWPIQAVNMSGRMLTEGMSVKLARVYCTSDLDRSKDGTIIAIVGIAE